MGGITDTEKNDNIYTYIQDDIKIIEKEREWRMRKGKERYGEKDNQIRD